MKDILTNMELLIPLGIFLARICDVTVGTIRIAMIARERRFAATILGFFEVLIWLAAIGVVMAQLHHWWNFIAYAGGFAAGNFLGVSIQRWLALGEVGVRVITARDASPLVINLRALGYGVTVVAAHGAQGPVSICYLIVHRRDLPYVIAVVQAFNPRAFYTLEDIRYVSSGVMPSSLRGESLNSLLNRWQKEHPRNPEFPEADLPSPGAGSIPLIGASK